MVRPAWLLGLVLLALPACTRPITPEQASARLVGIWQHVRQNGQPVPPRTDVSGLMEIEPGGVLKREAPVEVYAAGVLQSRNVQKVEDRFRFLDGETMEVTGNDRGQVRTWRVRAVLAGTRLTLHKPDGVVDDYDRIK
ncbi:hypothetical protein [Urbifossiella limnaea]|uniref:Lipocalin-like domain-containing protein n=1 Tax=Urbifossiella limnaea TaxID=2528023 RepID=A0A517Y2W6_9BACT|nr:hypothetical protein [Urbifossiella limnaea]QDU24105.1 hypothetical protein ETAA1_61180 [Urbifossiella limnaea]